MSEKIEIDVDTIKKHLESLASSPVYSDVSSLFHNYNVNSLHEYWAERCEKISKNISDYFVVNSLYNLQTAENMDVYVEHMKRYKNFLENFLFFSEDNTIKILQKLRLCEYEKMLIYDTENKHDCLNTNYDFISWLIFLDYCVLFSGNGSKDLTVDESASNHHLEELDYLLGCLFAMENADLSKDCSFDNLYRIICYSLRQYRFGDNFCLYMTQYISEDK